MKMKYVSWLLALVIVVVLAAVLLKGKGAPQEATAPTEPVTIGIVTFAGYAPFYLADEKEMWGQGLDVEMVRIESIGDLRAALSTGGIDMYAATYDIFEAIEGDEPSGVAFLAVDESRGGDGVVVREGINALSDLRGKVVGAEPGFPPYFILQHLLNQEGMTLADVDFRDVTSQDAGNAFVAGQLDVAATYEPYLSMSANKVPGAKVLVSSADTPGLIVDLVFASERLVEDRPEVLKGVAEGWFRAIDYWKANPEESYAIMADAFEVSVDEMKEFKSGIAWFDLEKNQRLFDKTTEHNVYATFDLVGDILEANNQTSVRLKADDHLTDAIIRMF